MCRPMQPDFSLSMTYPDGKDKPPVCDSSAILSAFNMSALASEYIKRPLKWRRQAGTRGRNWAATEPPIHLYKYRQIVADDLQSIDRTRQLLVHGRIWFADPSSLNDLHDMRFKLELDPNLQVRRDWECPLATTNVPCPKASRATKTDTGISNSGIGSSVHRRHGRKHGCVLRLTRPQK